MDSISVWQKETVHHKIRDIIAGETKCVHFLWDEATYFDNWRNEKGRCSKGKLSLI